MRDTGDWRTSGHIATEMSPAELLNLFDKEDVSGEANETHLKLRIGQDALEMAVAAEGYRLISGLDGEDTEDARDLLAERLAASGIRHRFEIYEDEILIGYMHHDWPMKDDGDA